MNKLTEIAKANGADYELDYADDSSPASKQEYITFTPDQLLATVEQVCAPLEKQLIDSRATFLALQPDFGGPVSAQMGLAIKRINDTLIAYRASMGDKHEHYRAD